MMMVIHIVLVALALPCCFCATISVHLQAPWPTHNLSAVAETAEFLNTIDSSLFWPFVKAVASNTIEPGSHLTLAEDILQEAEVDPEMYLQLLQLALELRSFSPTIEQQHQLANGSGHLAWADVFIGNDKQVLLTDVEVKEKLTTVSCDESVLAAEVEKSIFSFDHVKNEKATCGLVILNGVLGSKEFASLFTALSDFDEFKVVVRLVNIAQQPEQEGTILQGYGVSLDIKNMEYITIDDGQQQKAEEDTESVETNVVKGVVFSKLAERFPDSVDQLDQVRETFVQIAEEESASSGTIEKLKVWEMAHLGLQATKRILDSSEPLRRFENLVHNFPLRAHALAKDKVSSKIKRAVKAAGEQLVPSGTILVNGVAHDVGSESFNLFALLEALQQEVELAMEASSLGLQLHSLFGQSEETSDVLRVDVRKDGRGAIQFINNVEKESRYASWPKQLQALLQPARSLIPVRKNLYTLIFVLDPSLKAHRTSLRTLLYFIEVGIPVRVGLVFISKEAAEDKCGAACFLKLYLKAKKSSSKSAAFTVLGALASAETSELSITQAVAIYKEAMAQATGSWTSGKFATEAEKAIAGSTGEDKLVKMQDYAKAKGFTAGCWSLNGIVRESGSLERELTMAVFEEQKRLVAAVWSGELTDDMDVLKHLLTKSSPRYHPTILQPVSEQTFVPIQYSRKLQDIQYIRADEEAKVTVFLFLDLTQDDGGMQLYEAVLNSDAECRVAVAPVDVESQSLWSTQTQLADSYNEQSFAVMQDLVGSIGTGGSFLVVNGRVVTAALEADEVTMLIANENVRSQAAETLLSTVHEDMTLDHIMCVAALTGRLSKSRRHLITFEEEQEPLVVRSENKGVFVQTVVNPLSPEAQNVAPVLRILSERLNAHVELLLLPEPTIAEFPLPNFYRFVAGEKDLFPVATFDNMPKAQLLTLKVFTPEPWIVYPSDTGGADTDNIRLENDGDVDVEFTLRSLLVTGHSYAKDTNEAPAGLQLELFPHQKYNGLNVEDVCIDEDSCEDVSVHSDTLVMNNLGYFQLQAQPGSWEMQFADGPSRNIYTISGEEDFKRQIVVRDFVGKVEELVVEKREGMESEELLEQITEAPEEETQNLWSSVKSKLFKKDTTNETIHVFSLASGALYERFLRIMMVSVVSHTKNPVKFWIIENFLSPGFKDKIPLLAAKYQFEYALVTYKWPHWLRRQTEKQRIIWGYKILFLDVLFPLNVPKVIYVDADQVVRADLKELWDMNLQGRPYGYTPFCDSRKETLGYQFWRSGYWKDHLRGRPYHISALYVVDLIAFRRMAVGDRLRAVYDNLSRDPNSLSNLDQDLPNYAQNSVPIFSLPQEWLWCESWCSDASKATAKTIDLCNNPLHKEPKLDMAKRVISGPLFDKSWVELDQEIKDIIGT